MPRHTIRSAPRVHSLISLVGRAAARFFMTPQREVAHAQLDCREHINDFANVRDELETHRAQIHCKRLQTFIDERHMLRGHVRLRDQARLVHIQRKQGAVRARLHERRMIGDAQIAFEPDDIHSNAHTGNFSRLA